LVNASSHSAAIPCPGQQRVERNQVPAGQCRRQTQKAPDSEAADVIEIMF
jgi:hypothetical protein